MFRHRYCVAVEIEKINLRINKFDGRMDRFCGEITTLKTEILKGNYYCTIYIIFVSCLNISYTHTCRHVYPSRNSQCFIQFNQIIIACSDRQVTK